MPLVDFDVKDAINEMEAACADVSWYLKTMQRNNQTLANWWSTKDYTGKKNRTNDFEPKPFNGAADHDVWMSKNVLRKRNAMRVAGMARGALQVEPTNSTKARQSGLMRQALRYYMAGPMKAEVLTQAVRVGSYSDRYRCGLLYVGWKESRGVEPIEFTVEQIASAWEQMEAQEEAAHADGMMVSENAEDYSARVLDPMYETKVVEIMLALAPGLVARGDEGKRQARRAAAQLRKGETSIAYASYVKESRPTWEALQPFVDVFFPAEAWMEDGMESCRWVARVKWRSAQWIKEQAALKGWNKKWVEDVLKNHKGRSRLVQRRLAATPWALTTLGVGWSAKVNSETHNHLYEIIELWDRSMTKDGLAGTYTTVLHADVTDKVAIRELRADWDGMYPFVPVKFDMDERMLIAGDSLPELTSTAQQAVKAQWDSRTDAASMTTFPTWTGDPELAGLKPVPGQFLPALRGKLPEVLKLNPPDNRSIEIETSIRDSIDELFGFESRRLTPAQAMTMQQAEMDWFLASMSQAVARTAKLIGQYMPPLVNARISGTNEIVNATADEVRGDYNFTIAFNVMSTDVKWVKEHLGMISDVVDRLDKRGYVNTLPVLQAGLNIVDPTLAPQCLPQDAVAVDRQAQEQASNKITNILGGDPKVDLTEGMDFAGIAQAAYDDIMGSPLRQQNIVGGTQPHHVLVAWLKGLVNNNKQKDNAMIGRTMVEEPMRQPTPPEQMLGWLEQLPPGVSLFDFLNQSQAAA